MISLIFPAFNEQDNLEKLYDRLHSVLKGLPDEFEIIFIDDGSRDRTPQILKDLHLKDPRIKIIKFARNYGGHAALSAGLEYCSGDCAITLASDLQDPPELIKQLIDKWKAGSEIVWAVRSDREGESFSTKIFSRLYYFLINRLTPIRMPTLGADVFLAGRKAINAYKSLSEKNTSIYMMFAWFGFTQEQVLYVKGARYKGQSRWTLTKKIKLVLDSLLSFSDVPIRAISSFGMITAFLGFLYALKVFWGYINGSPVEGWSSLMVAILFIGGVQMMMLGVLGEYLWRTFDESRRRPSYVIDFILDREKDPSKLG